MAVSRAWLLDPALFALYSDFSPAFLVEKCGRGLRDKAGNGIVDFALCKTISILSFLKILPAKITRRSTMLSRNTKIR
jgi:hypothetical protein